MRVPITININTLRTYCNVESDNESNNHINIRRFSSVLLLQPKLLQELCIEKIAENWESNPIFNEIPLMVDRYMLLNILSPTLPLKLTIPLISDDFYWKKCYIYRWPNLLPSGSHKLEIRETINVANNSDDIIDETETISENQKRTWKQFYVEMHIREYLENLLPENYNPTEMKELSNLCSNHVKILNIRKLQCAENAPNHIPFNSILNGFPYLNELSICFKQKYSGQKFNWNILRVSLQDVKLLAKGLEKCRLNIFRVINSNIDDKKALYLIKALMKNPLRTIDFSHCKVSNKTAAALTNLSISNNSLEEIILTNNKIGSKGAEVLAYACCQEGSKITKLNLSLNYISKNGGNNILKALINGAKLVYLDLSNCGLNHENVDIGKMLEKNSSLEYLNLRNNNLGPEMGKILHDGLQYNHTMKKIDIRMCNLKPKEEFDILQTVNNNLTKKIGLKIVEPCQDFYISEDLYAFIQHIFDELEVSEEAV